MVVRVEDVQRTDVVQVCMTGTIFTAVTAYLVSRGLTVNPYPLSNDDDLPTFMVGISDRLMQSAPHT